jgi:hypothetical protein
VILLLLHHPEVQARAYDEILSVVGRVSEQSCPEYLPSLKDRDSLPYIDSIVKEALRFHPVVPLVSHANSEAGKWNDKQGEKIGALGVEEKRYRIDKGTWILANVWYVLTNSVEAPTEQT